MNSVVRRLNQWWHARPRAWRQNRSRSGQEGQALAMGMLSLFAFLALSALLVDGGMAFTQRRKVQNAADAAAFAGARQLSLGATDSQIADIVRDYAVARNGAETFTAKYVPGNETVGTGAVPGNAKGIAVTTHSNVQTFFAGAVGFQSPQVAAAAKASFGGVRTPGPNVQPLARKCDGNSLEACGFEYGESYDIWESDQPGNFGWLSWTGENNTTYLRQELTPGHVPVLRDPVTHCTELAVGCWVQGLPGTVNAVDDKLDYWKEHPETPMIVIIYDQSEGTGSNVNYRIRGFAAFILESYSLAGSNGNGNSGNNGTVMGRFVKWVVPTQVDPGGGAQFGLTSVHLTR